MKNRANQILLAVTIGTALLYAIFLVAWLELFPLPFRTPFRYSSLGACLGVGFHIIPCFCLQLLVCRVTKRLVPRLIPLLVLVAIIALFVMLLSAATGWDILWWALMLALCAAPMVGFALAWAAYGIRCFRLRNHE